MVDVEAVMMGGFSDTEETPGRVVSCGGKRFKRFRGMALTAADDDREDKEIDIDTGECVESLTPYKARLNR
jgi:inosine-5''-monophosphate dehydrogenase (EC 1.1.1.205)